jgi:hypothetical protein
VRSIEHIAKSYQLVVYKEPDPASKDPNEKLCTDKNEPALLRGLPQLARSGQIHITGACEGDVGRLLLVGIRNFGPELYGR